MVVMDQFTGRIIGLVCLPGVLMALRSAACLTAPLQLKQVEKM